MQRQILIGPSLKLQTSCHVVKLGSGDSWFGQNIDNLVRDLIDTMVATGAAGLSANQIGVQQRVFVVDKHIAGAAEHQVFINAQLLSASGKTKTISDKLIYDFLTEKTDEGCMSFPQQPVRVERAFEVRVSAQDLSGEVREVIADGIYARCLQHEIDHVSGKTILDHAKWTERQRVLRRLRRG